MVADAGCECRWLETARNMPLRKVAKSSFFSFTSSGISRTAFFLRAGLIFPLWRLLHHDRGLRQDSSVVDQAGVLLLTSILGGQFYFLLKDAKRGAGLLSAAFVITGPFYGREMCAFPFL